MGVFLGNAPQNTPNAFFYRSLSRAVTEVNRERIKQSFQLCGISAKGFAVPVEHLHARLRGILGYQEGLELVQKYDDVFEDERMSSTASNSEYKHIVI